MKVAAFLLGAGIAFTATAATMEETAMPGSKPPADIDVRLEATLRAKGPGYRPRTRHLRADGGPVYTNRLILEDSPYLLQHAHNPVDWFPWGDEAFAKARREDRPILVSIGYSTCHWCHVMEEESFEDEAVADFLNAHFVAVKVDRETHPAVDETYMSAMVAMHGHGGWPLNVLLLPDGRPFFAVSYLPRGRFIELLDHAATAWREARADIEARAAGVAEHLRAAAVQRIAAERIGDETLALAVSRALSLHDAEHGGFGRAPKFPHEPLLELLLSRRDERALAIAARSLEAMGRGGIHDQIGGGFHRYSVDEDWLVPHFEKMLYNQAQLAFVYLEGWRLTGNGEFKRIARATLDFALREMRAPAGGFYAAFDADSEGGEGRYYLWTPGELVGALGPEDAALAAAVFGVTARGNFEGANILHRGADAPQSEDAHLDGIRARLLAARSKRAPPHRDDKIVTGWNGLMIRALARAGRLLDDETYAHAAREAAEYLWARHRAAPGRLWRASLDGRPSAAAAVLEDYAFLALALIDLYDTTGEAVWRDRARELADASLARFARNDGGLFAAEDETTAAIGRLPDRGEDGATPAASAALFRALARLAARTGEARYTEAAQSLLAAHSGAIVRSPETHPFWLAGVDEMMHGERSSLGYAARGAIRVTARLEPGAKTVRELRVRIGIPPGWHVNAHRTGNADLVATTLVTDTDAASGFTLSTIDYPEGKETRLGFSEETLAVYEGTVELRARVEGKDALLPLALTLQACTDEVCLPPETLRIEAHPGFIAPAGAPAPMPHTP